jgi:outer membrane autotransporter protein
LGERLEGDPSGDMLTAYIEAGLNLWRCGRNAIQPLAAFQFSTLHIDGFTESGGDSALTFDDERYESYKGSLGVKLTRQLFEHATGGRTDLELRGRWVHEFGDTNATFDAAFASEPGVTFRVSDEDISRDSAILGAGLDTWFTRQTRLFLDYGTELNPDHTIHLVSAGLEHRW